MSLYAVTIEPGESLAEIVADVRRLTDLSIADIRGRLRDGERLIVWDSHDYPLTMQLEDHLARILGEIRTLLSRGYTIHFSYSPARDDPWEDVTFEQVRNLMESELEYSRQERD